MSAGAYREPAAPGAAVIGSRSASAPRRRPSWAARSPLLRTALLRSDTAAGLLQQLPGHDHALDLVGALVNLRVVGHGYQQPGHTFEITPPIWQLIDGR